MAKSYWRLTLTFALATAIASSLLLPLFPTTTHADMSVYGSPIFAFEMASTPEDLAAIFGPAADPKHSERLAKMDQGNRLDFGLIVLYVLFLGLFSVAVYKQTGQRLWLIPAALVTIAGLFDVAENFMLLEISRDLSATPALKNLWYPVYAKFILIALNCLSAAYFMIIFSSNKAWKVAGWVALVACLFMFVSLSSPAQFGWVLQHAITLSWTPMLACAAYLSFVTPETNT